MNDKLDSPDDKFKRAKQLFARAGNDLDLLRVAVQDMDAALVQRLREFYPSLDVGPYELFNKLQSDHIIDAIENALIAWGHRIRNMSAHAIAHSLNRAHVEKYAAVVQTILKQTQRRDPMGTKSRQRTSSRASTKGHKLNKRPTPVSSVRPQPVPPPPITETRSVEISPNAESNEEFLERLLLQPLLSQT